ncbi:uncharacterized protein LOC110458095 isoform X3 [Mizuhopecten yessoensis]|uniref:uncharacterized protein LOC110458095 isoform X3 n=1 Tax=Mizuhopecten yessoensis TaxID=6573 RepID=UPI000B4590F5|nr:uncharacterized protein LOC110458095 isoform X3 [Mizuhopecten yessoensis]
MGACYSKSGHDALETPNQKHPHSRRHKNGVAVKIEYSSPTVQTEDTLPDSHRSNGGVAQHTGEEKEEEIEEKSALVNSGVGVAPSDSGIESLSPSEGEERVGSHTTSSDSKHCGTDFSEGVSLIHCACDPPQAWHSVHTRHESDRKYKSCDSAPVTPQSEEPPSVIGAEHVTVDIPHSKRSSRDLRSLRVHFDSEPSLTMYPSLQDVKTMQMDGKEVVVIDANTYGQIMEELSTLKLALSQLTDLMQLQEVEQGGSISDDMRGKLEFLNSPS